MPCVIFSHGQDGEPWGSKIVALADVARRCGFQVESVDYRGIPDPTVRVARLLEFCKTMPAAPVLVGSSMGGHVAAAVSRQVAASGLFLMAPAFFMPGFEQHTPVPADCPVAIVHGWNDDIVPVDHSIRFARQYRCELHVLDSDHRLTASIAQICELFAGYLQRLSRSAT